MDDGYDRVYNCFVLFASHDVDRVFDRRRRHCGNRVRPAVALVVIV